MQLLDEAKILSNFLDSLPSPVTREEYTYCLQHFLRFHRLTKYSQLVTISHDQIYDYARQYIISLRDRNLATNTILHHITAIKSFYEMNDIEGIKWKKLKKYMGERTANNEDRAYTHEEILKVVNSADLRLKSIILFMACTGVRIGALPILRVGRLLPSQPSQFELLPAVTIYANTSAKYITFITPEARKAINEYLAFRERCGERITPDSPLFRLEFDSEFIDEARNNVRPMSYRAMRSLIYKALIRCGLRQVNHVNHEMKEIRQNHGFRKFFQTQLVKAGVRESAIKKLMGHSDTSELTLRYYKPTLEDLAAEYEKATELLTIDPANRLQKKITEMEKAQDKFDKVLTRIDDLEKQLGIA